MRFRDIAGALIMTSLAALGRAAEEFPAAHIFVANTGRDEILEFHPNTGDILARFGDGIDGFDAPWDLAFGPDGLLYVTTNASDRVFVFAPGNELLTSFDLSASASGLRGICVAPDGSLWVAAHDSNALVNLERDGTVRRVVDCPAGLGQPIAPIFGRRGSLWVAIREQPMMLEFHPDGTLLRKAELPSPASALASGFTNVIQLTLDQTMELANVDDATGEVIYGISPLPPVGGMAMTSDVSWCITIGGVQLTRQQFAGAYTIWGFGELEDAHGVTVAPYWTANKFTYQGSDAQGFGKKFSEKIRLGLFPGESQLLMRFEPDGEMVTMFGTDGLALPGVSRSRYLSVGETCLFTIGLHVAEHWADLPSGHHLSVSIEAIEKGKLTLQKDVTSIKGQLHIGSPNGVGHGRLKLAKVK